MLLVVVPCRRSAAAGGADVLVELEQVGRVVPFLDGDQAGVGVGRVGGLDPVLSRFGGEVDVAADAPGVHGPVGAAGPAGVLVEALAAGRAADDVEDVGRVAVGERGAARGGVGHGAAAVVQVQLVNGRPAGGMLGE